MKNVDFGLQLFPKSLVSVDQTWRQKWLIKVVFGLNLAVLIKGDKVMGLRPWTIEECVRLLGTVKRDLGIIESILKRISKDKRQTQRFLDELEKLGVIEWDGENWVLRGYRTPEQKMIEDE